MIVDREVGILFRKEVRQLERENLDLYRGTGLSRRDTQGRYISTKDDQLDG